MSHHSMSKRTLDARPDRIDFRDLTYRPPLVSLPDRFPSDFEISTFIEIYLGSDNILDQGTEGACTGFGLAAVINYILWDRMIRESRAAGQSTGTTDISTAARLQDEGAGVDQVSPHMLYDIAKMYDEWEGEDYSGSSCRGALKGWHKHGVCAKPLWRDPSEGRFGPVDGWRENAAERPLGAYYRVESRSISDLQAAIHEVRAVYCSARVHDGWTPDGLRGAKIETIGGIRLPIIEMQAEITGGHAFALVGYTRKGFILQNSWGQNWGYKGFALLTYEDWIENGNDAWVAALGAPMSIAEGTTPRNRTATPLSLTATMRSASARTAGPSTATPWSSDTAYDHAVVLGNEGMPLRRRIDALDAVANLRLVSHDLPLRVAQQAGGLKVAIYAHGGLNSEKAAMERAMRLGPWFQANGIYPIFVVWRTSLLDALANIGQDFVTQFLARRDDMRSEALGSGISNALNKLQDTFDKAFEVAAEGTVGKPVWSQMKQNAGAAADGTGGTRRLFENLRDLKAALDGDGLPMELHLVGHSAGAILLGHMLDDFDNAFRVETATLFAPACTSAFAARHYGRALARGAIRNGGLHIDALSEQNERGDTVGPYGKSLLYLVSRALETPRKQPILGLAQCLDAGNPRLAKIARGTTPAERRAELNAIKALLGADYSDLDLKHVRDWRDVVADHDVTTRIQHEREFIMKTRRFEDAQSGPQEEQVKIPATHGGFDNSLGVMNGALARILGGDAPTAPIDDLSGF